MSKEQRHEQTNTVSAAEQAVAQLEENIQRHRDRAAELAAARKSSAYAARVLHDVEQSKILDGIIEETSKHAIEGDALSDALDEAKRRLEEARQDAACSADRAAAKLLRDTFKQFVALAVSLDEALATVVETSAAMNGVVNEIHACGHGAPTGQQFLTYGERAAPAQPMTRPVERRA